MTATNPGRDTTSDGASDPFVPLTARSNYQAPRATIDPDRSLGWFRRIRPIIGTHKVVFIAAIALSFLGLILQVAIPALLSSAIDFAIAPTKGAQPSGVFHSSDLGTYVIIISVLGVASGISGYLSRRFLFEMAYSFEFDLRNLLYKHMTEMSFSFFDRVQTGQLISRANSDIRSVQMYTTFAPMILVQSSIAIVAFIIMLSINVVLALIAMATMPFVYLVGVKMRQDMFPLSWIIQSRLADVATIVDENVNGVRVVKSFAAEEAQVRHLANSAQKVAWSYVKDADLRAKWTPLIQNLPQLGLVFVLFFGGIMVIQGTIPVGNILAFNAYLLMLQAPFMMLGMLIMMGQRAAASADRIFEILDEQPTIVDHHGAVDLVSAQGDIVFDHVSFSYRSDTQAILDDFSLTIHQGETVALVGRTGSGKSTVARLLTRFYDVTSGTLRVAGHDVRDLTLASLRAQVGVVLDEPFLFSASVRENIAYGRPDATIDEIIAAATAAGADAFITRLESAYDTVVGERGYTLSGGQRQRIAIARTLLVNPPILILDDATSAIDVHVEQQIHHALETLLEHRTTLIVAHRLSTISLAARVVLLDEGRIVADGTHADLLATSPLYAEILAQVEEDEEVDVA